MPKVLVTGASGHIGSQVAKVLLERGYLVELLIRKENINTQILEKAGAVIHKCDLMNPETYRTFLSNVDCVFHLAAENTTKKSEKEKVISSTIGITQKFFITCLEEKVPVIIYTSSVVVLGRSIDKRKLITENDQTSFVESPYVEGKIAAEKFVERLINEKDADIRRLYPSWVIGKGDPKMTPPHQIIANYIDKGQFFYFSGGISLSDIRQVAEAHVNAFEIGKKQGKYVLGGDNITFKDFYNILSKYSKHGRPFLFIPKSIIVAGAIATKPIFKLLGMESILDPEYAKSVFGNYSWYDSQKAINELKYNPTDAQKILADASFEAQQRLSGTLYLGNKRNENTPLNEEKGKLLITGVPGWLGNRMVDILINGNNEGEFQSSRKVNLLVQTQYAGQLNLPSNFEIIYGDINNQKAVNEALEGVTTVFHIAGAIYPSKIKTLYEVNTEGAKTLVDACIKKGIRRIIFMATDSIGGKGTKKKRVFDEFTEANPYRNYGKSKFLAEKYILDKTKEGLIDGTSMRGFWFFGPFAPQRQLGFFKMFSLPRQIVFGNGKNYRSISHVDNIIQAFFKAEKRSESFGKWYWICGDEAEMTIDEMYGIICSKFNYQYKPLYIPVWMCKMFSLADYFLGMLGRLNSTIHAAGKFYFDIAGRNDAAKRDFGYDPKITFEQAAEELKNMI